MTFLVIASICVFPGGIASGASYVKGVDQENSDPAPGVRWEVGSGETGDYGNLLLTSTSTASFAGALAKRTDTTNFDNGGVSLQTNGSAGGSRVQTWMWDGFAGTHPGAQYQYSFLGSGSVLAGGTVTGVTLQCMGCSGASSTSGTSTGSATDVEVELISVGGSASLNQQGMVGGSFGISPTGLPSASANISVGTTGVGSFNITGAWTINHSIESSSCFGLLSFVTTHNCLASFSVQANGASGFVTGDPMPVTATVGNQTKAACDGTGQVQSQNPCICQQNCP